MYYSKRKEEVDSVQWFFCKYSGIVDWSLCHEVTEADTKKYYGVLHTRAASVPSLLPKLYLQTNTYHSEKIGETEPVSTKLLCL